MMVDPNSDDQIFRLFPILKKYSGSLLCPSDCETAWIFLAGLLAHLNDTHRWPRTEKDRNKHNQGLPTISGWLKEEAEKNGWDLTCRLPN